MKKLVLAVLALAMMVSAIAAMADSEKSFSITPRIAANIAVDKDTKDWVGNQFGVLADIDIASWPVGIETGYLAGQKSNEIWSADKLANWDTKTNTWTIPLMATYTYPFSDQFYAKAALGVNFIHTKFKEELVMGGAELGDVDNSKTRTNLGFKLGLGWNFLPNWSAEVMYANSGKVKFEDYFGDELEYKTSFVQVNVGYTF